MARPYRRAIAQSFMSRVPVNPMTTEHETLVHTGVRPYCTMVQVAAEDTHDDYLICRGWDARDKRYYDYVEGDANQKGIAVAKPYGVRGDNAYVVGEIHAAFLPLIRLSDSTGQSQNPGKAQTTVGHPADLTEKVVALKTDEGNEIVWMMVGAGVSQLRPKCHFTLDEELTISDESVEATIVTQYGQGSDHESTAITVYNLPTHTGGVYEFYGDSGDYGIASYAADPNDLTKWYIDIVECP